MILEALYQLAIQDELVADADFEVAPVAWLVRVDGEGRMTGPMEGTHAIPEGAKGKKPKPVAKSFSIPRRPTGRSGTKAPAAFFVDNAKYVFGRGPDDRPVDPKDGGEKSGWFRDLVARCAEATEDEGAFAVLKFLDRVRAGEASELVLPEGFTPADLFAFIYAPDVDLLVHRRPAIRAYWSAARAAGPGGRRAGVERRCMITGEVFTGDVGLFPLIKRVPGGTPSGVSLVSFNAGAFESYGWRSNENAPISRAAAEAAATALSRLVHPAFPDPRPDGLGSPLPRRHVRLSSDTLACFWADRPDVEFLEDLTTELDPDPQVVGEMIESPTRGDDQRVEPSLTTVRAPGAQEARFYALVITGTQGRAIIRNWIDKTVGEVQENVDHYWKDLDVVRNTPPPKGKELPRHFPQRILLTALAPFGRFDDIPAALAADLFRAAISGERYPLAALQKALERARAEIGRSEWADLYRRDARAALVKAVLVRNFEKELSPAMDPDNTEPGYLLGRMMAVLERLQQLALGADVNATVIDRYFGAASATPQAVYPRLLKNARHHARKAEDGTEAQSNTAKWLDRQLDEIAAALKVDRRAYGPGAGFPAHLPLEQQGLFLLGYHHQRHWLWMKKEDRERAAAERAQAAAVA
jgi:CRISPR-associated protein Csd1